MAEFHPELTEEEISARELSLQLAALNLQSLWSVTGNRSDGTIEVMGTAGTLVSEDYAWAEGRIKEMNDQIKQTMAIPATEQLVQHLVEKFGIDPDKLRISVIQHQVEMAPDRDLEISVGTFEPANPVFDALNAMRNQFEHPSLRMVNREYDRDE